MTEEESLRTKKKICNTLMEEKDYNKIHKHLENIEDLVRENRLIIKGMILDIKTNREIDEVMNMNPSLKDGIILIEDELNLLKDELL